MSVKTIGICFDSDVEQILRERAKTERSSLSRVVNRVLAAALDINHSKN